MIVVAVRDFIATVGGTKYSVQDGERLTLPVGADWVTAGLVVPEIPVATTNADDFSVDAFGRRRISDTGQRFDVELTLDLQPDLLEQMGTGGGSITHNSTHRVAELAIGDTTEGSYRRLVQGWHNPYTPGNSQLIEITGTLDGADIGGGTAAIFLRNNGEDTVVAQDSWDNASAVADVDWTTSQIFAMDFQSLKIGRVRFGLVRSGVAVPIHEITNDNVRLYGYWQYPNQPVQWHIYNDGSGNTVAEMGYFDASNGIGFRYTLPANASAKLIAVCATVKSEGGRDLGDIPGITRAADTGVSPITVSSTEIPLLSFRPKLTLNSLANYALVYPSDLIGYATGNDAIMRVYKNATLTGASWTSRGAASVVEFDISATAFTGGELIGSIPLPASNQSPGVGYPTIRSPLSLNYAGDDSDIITITMVRFGTGDASAWASASWTEIK